MNEKRFTAGAVLCPACKARTFIQDKLERQNRPPTNDAALAEVLKSLKAHSLVAWAERQNSGDVLSGGRFIRFFWVGSADVLGQKKDGRFLSVEAKAAKDGATPEKFAFLKLTQGAGILAQYMGQRWIGGVKALRTSLLAEFSNECAA